MKRGTPDHPKTEMLARLLGVEVAQAVGHLEMLWHFASKHAPRGDVGRWPDETIAKRSGWNREPVAFITALIDAKGAGRCGWLERHESFRLVIHDWHEHADDAVKKWLANHQESFWNGLKPFAKRSGMNRESVGKKHRLPEPSQSLAKPEPEPVQEEPQGFLRFWAKYPKSTRKTNRKACLSAWIKRGLEAKADRIVVGLDAAKNSKDWLKNGGEFIPAPLVWLNQERWEAAIEAEEALYHDPTPEEARGEIARSAP